MQISTVESKRFVGLPTPAAAGMVASCVLIFFELGGSGTIKKVSVLLLIYLLASLMVSNFRYYSFKDPELFRRQPFGILGLGFGFALFHARQLATWAQGAQPATGSMAEI